eukprot:2918157-Prymnesium_polylepis.1
MHNACACASDLRTPAVPNYGRDARRARLGLGFLEVRRHFLQLALRATRHTATLSRAQLRERKVMGAAQGVRG